jgi:hypothetical protein
MSEEINKLFTAKRPYDRMLGYIAEKYPGCFTAGYPRRALKRGIRRLKLHGGENVSGLQTIRHASR